VVVLLIAPLMKLARLFFFALVALLSSLSLAQYPQAWSAFKDLGQPTTERCKQVISCPGGGYLVLAEANGSSSITRIADSGAVVWIRMAPGIGGEIAANSTGIAVLGFYHRVGGYFDQSGNIRKFDLSGNVIWSSSFTLLLPDAYGSVAMDSAGNVISCDEENSHIVVRKYAAATGATTTLVTVPFAYGPTMRCDANGSIYLASQSLSQQFASTASKYDANGSLLWSKSAPGNYGGTALDGAGNFYFSYGTTISQVVTQIITKYDSSGNVVWSTPFPTQSITKLAVSNTGVVLAARGDETDLYRFDAAGKYQWTRSYNFSPPGPIGIDSNGNGFVIYADSNDLHSVKVDPAGNLLWNKSVKFDSLINFQTNQALCVDQIGRLAVLFGVKSVITQFDPILHVYNTDGTDAWSQSSESYKSCDTVLSSKTDSAGNTYIGSAADGLDSDARHFAVTKFTTTGGAQWSKLLPTMAPYGTMVGPRLVPTGGCVAAESVYTQDPATGELHVSRFDASGNVLWTYNVTGVSLDAKDIDTTADGSVFVLCNRATFDNNFFVVRLRIIKINANGTAAWTADPPGSLASYDRQLETRLATDASGNAYATFALQTTPSLANGAILKVDSTGAYKWTKYYDSSFGQDSGDDVAVDSAGYIYFLARHDGEAQEEWLHKLDTAGNELWSASVNPMWFANLSIDSSDRIFACGINAIMGKQVGSPLVQRLSTTGASPWTHLLLDSKIAEINYDYLMAFVPDNLGGGVFATRAFSPTSYQYKAYRFGANGDLVWPATGGAFQSGTLVHQTGLNDCLLGGAGMDGVGNLYLTGSTFGPSGSLDLNVVKYNACDSVPGGQFTTSQMAAGQTYQVAVVYQNTGLETWTNAGGYRLITLNSSTWGIGSIYLANSDAIAPGQSKTFYFYVTAPATPGSYNLQTKMYRNGFGSFGVQANTPNVTVTVRSNAARNVSMIAPASVKAGSTFQVSVDMLNVGTNTWTLGGGYVLAPTTGFPIWNAASIPLLPADSIVKGAHKVFAFNCTAPASPGSYKMSWQMKAGPTYFGDQSIAKTITVTP